MFDRIQNWVGERWHRWKMEAVAKDVETALVDTADSESRWERCYALSDLNQHQCAALIPMLWRLDSSEQRRLIEVGLDPVLVSTLGGSDGMRLAETRMDWLRTVTGHRFSSLSEEGFQNVVKELAEIGTSEAVGILREEWEEADSKKQSFIVESTVHITNRDAIPALSAWVDNLWEKKENQQAIWVAIADTLVRTLDPEAIPILRKVIEYRRVQDPSGEEFISKAAKDRMELLQILITEGSPEERVTQIQESLSGERPWRMEVVAALALSRIDDVAILDPILPLLTFSHDEIQSLNLGNIDEELMANLLSMTDPRVVPYIVRRMTGSDIYTAEWLIELLGQLGAIETFPCLMTELMEGGWIGSPPYETFDGVFDLLASLDPYALHTAEFLPECPVWEGLPFETEWTRLN